MWTDRLPCLPLRRREAGRRQRLHHGGMKEGRREGRKEGRRMSARSCCHTTWPSARRLRVYRSMSERAVPPDTGPQTPPSSSCKRIGGCGSVVLLERRCPSIRKGPQRVCHLLRKSEKIRREKAEHGHRQRLECEQGAGATLFSYDRSCVRSWLGSTSLAVLR